VGSAGAGAVFGGLAPAAHDRLPTVVLDAVGCVLVATLTAAAAASQLPALASSSLDDHGDGVVDAALVAALGPTRPDLPAARGDTRDRSGHALHVETAHRHALHPRGCERIETPNPCR